MTHPCASCDRWFNGLSALSNHGPSCSAKATAASAAIRMSAPVALNRESLNAGRKRPRFKYASAADIGRIADEDSGDLDV